MILDTNFIIDLMNNQEAALSKFNDIKKIEQDNCVSVLSIFELFTGIFMSKEQSKEEQKIVDALKELLVLDFDKDSAKKAGELNGGLRKLGINIGAVDSMIAGTALVKNETVLTKNIKHFSRIEGLKIESY